MASLKIKILVNFYGRKGGKLLHGEAIDAHGNLYTLFLNEKIFEDKMKKDTFVCLLKHKVRPHPDDDTSILSINSETKVG